MELVETVLALEEQVKRLEGQVKALQQGQKLASTVKPVQPPAIDSNALKQQLRGEFANQLNQLRTEVNQLKTSKAQDQPSIPVQQPLKVNVHPAYLALSMVGIGALILVIVWLTKPAPANTQVSPALSSQVASAKSQPTASAKLTKSRKRTPKKSPKANQVKAVEQLNETEVDQAISDLQAQGYKDNNPN